MSENHLEFWVMVDQLFSRGDMFPRLVRVDLCINFGSKRLQCVDHENIEIMERLQKLYAKQKVYFWGKKCESAVGLECCTLIVCQVCLTSNRIWGLRAWR